MQFSYLCEGEVRIYSCSYTPDPPRRSPPPLRLKKLKKIKGHTPSDLNFFQLISLLNVLKSKLCSFSYLGGGLRSAHNITLLYSTTNIKSNL